MDVGLAEELDAEPLSPTGAYSQPTDLKSAMRRAPPPAPTGSGPFAVRDKFLPQPPVGPVMPDFDDLAPRRRSSTTGFAEAAQVKRKTSVVKKIKDRVGK